MAFTTTQLAAIERAIASGELEVSYDGKTVKYRSMSELEMAYNKIKSALIAEGAIASGAIRTTYAAFRSD